MGGVPKTDPRGTADRGLVNRITTPVPVPPQDYPPFSQTFLDLSEQAAIPDALAYGLKWQIELDRLEGGSPEEQQKLAENLVALFDYLLIMQTHVERDPSDGALLYRDPLKLFNVRSVNAQFVEISYGTAIPISDPAPDVLPAWAPSVFPREFSAADRARYPQRPRTLARIPPFNSPQRFQSWLRLRAWRPAPSLELASVSSAIAKPNKPGAVVFVFEPPRPKPVDEAALDDTLTKAAAKYDADMAAGKTNRYSATPLVDKAIKQLSIYRLIDLRDATNAALQSPYENDKLIEHTEVVLYHSVYTVVLDRAGNPFDLRSSPDRGGLLDYGLLLPSPGSQMKRGLPHSGGLNVSVQQAGDTTFHIEDGKVTKVFLEGVGGFQEYGSGRKHELQKILEAFLVTPLSYIASLSAEAAFNPEEMSLGRIYLRLYDLAEAATPYVVKEIEARAKKMIVNWQDYAGSVIKGAIEQIIISEVRERIKAYLVKKIGKRIVPVVNAAFALYDLATGDNEHKHMRYAIACAVLAIRGRTAEDTELSAKVVSKVLADEFEEKIIQKLIEKAANAGKNLILRNANERADPKQQPKPAESKSEAGDKSVDDKSAQKAGADNPTAGQKDVIVHKLPVESAADAEARRQANVYVREKLAEAVETSKAAPTTAPDAPAAKADPRATSATAASDANRGKGDVDTAPAAAAPKKSKPTPEYWPGTGMHGPPTREQMGLGPPRRPRRKKTASDPPGQTMHIKDDAPPEDLQDVRTQLNPRTGSRSDVQVLRDNLAKAGTPVPPGHAAHHAAFRSSGGKTGASVLNTLSTTGVSKNVGDSGVAARGTPAAPLAPGESGTDASKIILDTTEPHATQHGEAKLGPLQKRLGTVTGEPDAATDILGDTSRMQSEGRAPSDPDFWLDSQSDGSEYEKRERRPKK
jgi:hypothetical protein